jgi:hypothetical protein
MIGILDILLAIHHLATGGDLLCVAWLLSGLYWIGSSVIVNNRENLKKLHERVTELENHAVTDIDKLGPNHFVLVRRLGPDKDYVFKEEQNEKVS